MKNQIGEKILNNLNNSIFFDKNEAKLTKDYLRDGFVICPVSNKESLEWIRQEIVNIAKKELDISKDNYDENFLDYFHKKIEISALNDFRLLLISKINDSPGIREKYYEIAKPYLDIIVGNELAMQKRINLSIQLPNDDSSLLPVHADTWSGDSPFEVVVWIPLVNCYETKSMFILPPSENKYLNDNFNSLAGQNSENLFNSIKSKVHWLEVNYGNILIFNQTLPHGNRINLERESRWTLNCRFKGIFTPYEDKKIGEFFEPITLRAASISGLNYEFPAIK